MKMLTTRRAALCAATATALAALAGTAHAQAGDYPNRPIRLIVPFSAGGAVDGPIRAIAADLSKRLKQQIVIENRPGATGNIGTFSAAYVFTLMAFLASSIAFWAASSASLRSLLCFAA